MAARNSTSGVPTVCAIHALTYTYCSHPAAYPHAGAMPDSAPPQFSAEEEEERGKKRGGERAKEQEKRTRRSRKSKMRRRHAPHVADILGRHPLAVVVVP